MMQATGDKAEMAGLKERLGDLESDLGLAGLVTVGEQLEDVKALPLVSLAFPLDPRVEGFYVYLKKAH